MTTRPTRKPAPLGRRIRRARQARNLSQVALAARAGVTPPYIVMLESGARTSTSIPVLKRLAKALDVDVAELLR
jgi:transcriptional regulator with XRE-family HTH domain